MKLYQHSGGGHYLGCTALAFADDIEDAKAIITKMLYDGGLSGEELNIIELPMVRGPIYIDNGDY